MEASQAVPAGGLFRALRGRNYRFFFAGQGISLVGTFLQQVALGWYVYRITGSSLLLGTLGFAGQIPSIVCAPWAGALADRWDRKKTLLAVQTLMGVQALVLAVLVQKGWTPAWSLVGLALLLGALNAFDIPFRQAFVSQMIDDRALLSNAIALNSALFNGARLVGPALGGVAVALWGETPCFFGNAASYVAVVAALWAIDPAPAPPREAPRSLGREILDGLAYVRGHRPIRDLLALVSAVGLLGLPFLVLLPVFARDRLHGDARTLGFLMGSGGAGALFAALFLAARKSMKGLLSRIGFAALLGGFAVAGLSVARPLWGLMVLIAASGFGFVTTAGGANTLIQTLVEDRFRGRVMSLYTLAFLGTSTFGSLWIGWLASVAGLSWAVGASGALFAACAAVFVGRLPGLRRETRERLVGP